MAIKKADDGPQDNNRRKQVELFRKKLPEYLEALGFGPEFIGGALKMRCPFHDDTNPSFEVYGEELTRWHCHPCGCGGDIFDLSIKLERSTDFKSALADVKAVLDGKVDFTDHVTKVPTYAGAAKIEVLKDGEGQKIMDAIFALNGAKSFNEPVMELIKDDLGFDIALLERRLNQSMSTLGLYDGRLAYTYPTGIKVRRFRSEGDPRFFWAFGKALAPWRAERVKPENSKVLLVEGETDCVVAVIAGVEDDGSTAVVASPGTSFSPKWKSVFEGKHVIICFDLDQPGRVAAERVARLLHETAASISVVDKKWKDGEPKDLRDLYLIGGASAVVDHIRSARDWIPVADDSPEKAEALDDPLPMLLLPGDNRSLGSFCSELGAALAGKNFYVRSGMPFASIPSSTEEYGHELKLINPNMFRSMIDDHVHTVRFRKTADGPVQVRHSIDFDTAQAVLHSPQFLTALPALDFVRPAPLPIIRRDGKLELLPVGYDPESRTLTYDEVPFDREMDIDTAKQIIELVLGEFQFPEQRSKSAAVSAFLTGICGHVLPKDSFVPCFLFDANSQGSGKTTLAQIAALPFGIVGLQPAPKHENEWRKRLLAMVMTGRGVTILDNVDHHIDSSSLSMYLTSYSYSDRILGVSQEFTGKRSAIIFMTGNKMTYSRDLARRVIVIDLFSEEIRAEERKFEKRINSKLLKKYRKLLLSAMWALVKEWDRAGRPKCSTTNASFPDWCEVVGGIVEHNGFGDPVVRGQRDDAGDIDTLDLENLAKVMGVDLAYAFKDIVAMCGKHGLFERFIDDTDELGQLSRQAKSGFGKILKSFDKRLVSGMGHFHVTGKGHYRRYAVVSPDEPRADEHIA
jgi:5S rRNA maturation endonuclease (ribonuclease M5)